MLKRYFELGDTEEFLPKVHIKLFAMTQRDQAKSLPLGTRPCILQSVSFRESHWKKIKNGEGEGEKMEI